TFRTVMYGFWLMHSKKFISVCLVLCHQKKFYYCPICIQRLYWRLGEIQVL
ncbi:uncharacterized protein METZ01_LOCUS224044, partial [marine metagenome]